MQPASTHFRPFSLPPSAILKSLPEDALQPLVHPAAWREMAMLAAEFPAAVQTVCFECRLSPEDDRTELAFNLFPGPEIVSLVEHFRRTQRTAAWSRFSSFLEEWISPESDWSWQIPFVCLAFDSTERADALPQPCVSLCIDPDFFPKRLGFLPAGRLELPDLLSLAEGCYQRLTGERLSPDATVRLASCLAAEDIDPKHLSVMLPRPEAPVKLDLRLNVSRLSPFLERIGWSSPAGALQEAVEEFVPWGGDIQLNLVLHPGLVQPLEVELFSGADEKEAEWRLPFLERLVDKGLASAAKAGVLRDAWTHPLSEDNDGRVLARSWYAKLRFFDARVANAKVYFGLIPRLLRHASAVKAPIG